MSSNHLISPARRLKVAQLIETMSMGGAEQLAVRIANHLASTGHESHLIILRGPGVLSARIQPEVRVHYLDFERASIGNPLKFAASLRQGLKLIRQVVEQEELSVVQTHLPGANFFGLLLAWQKACSVLVTIHNNQEFRYGDSDNRFLAWLRKWAYRQILLVTQGVIAVSQDVKDSLIVELGVDQAVADRICVVTNAVDTPDAIADNQILEIRQQFGCQPGEAFLLAAGRFCEQKNFGDLITAVNRLREMECAFHLVICGDGDQRSELASRVRHEGLETFVTLPGNLINLDDVMKAADVFVMSSLWEGLPLVLLEAMAAGLPTVAYRIPGVDEVVADGVTGILVPVGEPDGLAEKMAALIGDEEGRVAMGAAGLERIKTDFSFAKYMEVLTRQYENVAGAISEEKL